MQKNLTLEPLASVAGIAFVILLAGCESTAKLDPSQERTSLNVSAPPETELLGQLVGKWKVTGESRDRQGNWFSRNRYEEWHWYYILDGHALQDDFISILRAADRTDSTTVYGTNIRIYKAETSQWQMAWIHHNTNTVITFTATNEGNEVIMRRTNDQGINIRNTFFDMMANSFEWRQEWAIGEDSAWVAVAKLYAIRIY